MKLITILIVDDHKLIRETWSFILNSDHRFSVVAECSSGLEAIALTKKFKPDIILMDINMQPMNGLETTRLIRKEIPGSKVIIVSMHSQPAYVKQMMKLGGMGYVTKNSTREEMIKAIIEVHNGKTYICDEVKNILSTKMLGENKGPDINLLSKREIEIILLIKKGLSSKEVAQKLDISLKTVEVHRHNILKKLDLKNTPALIDFINKSGFDLE